MKVQVQSQVQRFKLEFKVVQDEVDMRRRAARREWFWSVLLTVAASARAARRRRRWRGRCRRRRRRPMPAPPPPPPTAAAGGRAGRRCRRCRSGRHHRVASRSTISTATRRSAAVLRARQCGGRRRRPAGAAGQRRGAEEIPDVADHDRRPLRRARHGRVQPRARRAPRAGGAAPTWSRSAFRPTRLQTVSYGKEFPFDAGHDEAAWSKNRRAHFVITAK